MIRIELDESTKMKIKWDSYEDIQIDFSELTTGSIPEIRCVVMSNTFSLMLKQGKLQYLFSPNFIR